MAFSTQYAQQYQQAVSAYMQGHYQDAASLTNALVSEYPDDPNLQLLCGHIYSCLKQYDMAQRYYHQVLQTTNDPELLNCAQNSLSDISQSLGAAPTNSANAEPEWSDFSFDNGEVTQIQAGLISSQNRADQPPLNLVPNQVNAPTAESHTGWRNLLFEDQSFEDNFTDSSESVESSDLFEDDDDDITLLMGKKGSQKEGSMSDEQHTDVQDDANYMDGTRVNAELPIAEDLDFSEDMTSIQSMHSFSDNSGEEREDFTDFLSHMDEQDIARGTQLESLDLSGNLNPTTAFDLGTEAG
ncbi:MAG TPA: hypothetical protein V6D19_06990, partial [Stenomitos sp.]